MNTISKQPIYLTNIGQVKFKNKLNEKKLTMADLNEQRLTLLNESKGADLSEPEAIQLQQQLASLAESILEIESQLASSVLINICDETRNLLEVRIGSIVKIKKYNQDLDKQDLEVWEIRGFDETDVSSRRLSYNSPLGAKLISTCAGDELSDVKLGRYTYDIEIVEILKSWN